MSSRVAVETDPVDAPTLPTTSTCLPYTTNPRNTALRGRLLNESDPTVCGAVLSSKDPQIVRSGLLKGWNADAAKVLMEAPKAIEPIEQAMWTEADAQFMRSLMHCGNPEQVDAIMPDKWRAYDPDSEFDSKLSRVCKLCTAVVERYVAWSSDDPARQPGTTYEWRLRAQLEDRIKHVISLLEVAIGEIVPMDAFLRDATLLRRCWVALDEESQLGVEAALMGASIHPTDGRGGGGANGPAVTAASSAAASMASSSAFAARDGLDGANNRRVDDANALVIGDEPDDSSAAMTLIRHATEAFASQSLPRNYGADI